MLLRMLFLPLLVVAHLAKAAPECTAPPQLQDNEATHFCMIDAFRIACLTRKGYDVESANWSVPLSAYDECTIRGCEQLMDEVGDLSETLFRMACDVAKVDRSG